MSTKTKVDTLWQQFRDAINQAYKLADKSNDGDGICLRDYAENISQSDDLAGLLGRETANERQHRSNRPSVPGFSTETAAKLILMNAALTGTETMPKATSFLVLRKTAAEAQVIGWLARNQLSPEWREAVQALDYAKLMQ